MAYLRTIRKNADGKIPYVNCYKCGASMQGYSKCPSCGEWDGKCGGAATCAVCGKYHDWCTCADGYDDSNNFKCPRCKKTNYGPMLCESCIAEGYIMDENGNVFKEKVYDDGNPIGSGTTTNTVTVPVFGEVPTKNILIALGIGFLLLLLVNKK